MEALERDGYTRQEVIDVLHSKHGARQLSFRYDLLDKTDVKKGELTTVEDATVDVNSLADIKRTAKFSLRDIEPKSPFDIGGRNLLRNTDFKTDTGNWLTSGNHSISLDTVDKYNDNYSMKIVATAAGTSGNLVDSSVIGGIKNNQEYTVSFYAKSISGNTTLHNELWGGAGATNFTLTTSWEKFTTKLTGKTVAQSFYLWLLGEGTCVVTLIKLEEGDKGTDWSPALEDTGYNDWYQDKKLVWEIENEQVNYLSDRIQPFAKLKMPDGGFAEFPLGIFLLSSPTRKDQNGQVYREVDAFDGLQVLLDDKFIDRYTVTTGTRYYDAVIAILQSAGITKWNIEQTDKVLATDLEFEPGREKLYAINELLRQINYDGLKHDVYGYYTSAYYRSPSARAVEYTYVDDKESITVAGMEETLDLFKVPNEFVVVMSNAEQAPLRSVYTNDSPDSPTSTVNRGHTIVDIKIVDNVADQQALDGYTQRVAFDASQVYGTVSFETAINPAHDIDDVLQIIYSKLGIDDKYSETKWSMQLKAGATMKHEVRRVITV